MNEWTNEWMNKWTNEQMNEWTNERMNKWTNEQMNELMKNKQINELMKNKRMNERTNEWILHWKIVNMLILTIPGFETPLKTFPFLDRPLKFSIVLITINQ